jgi:hypothetical protein
VSPAWLFGLALVELTLVELTGPDSQRIFVNPAEVTAVKEPRGGDTGHCLLLMADGRLTTVAEACDEVRHAMSVPHLILAAGIALVELHGPTGQVLEINPAEISSVRTPVVGAAHQHWGQGTRCILVMSNGRTNAVIEDCAAVVRLLRSGG